MMQQHLFYYFHNPKFDRSAHSAVFIGLGPDKKNCKGGGGDSVQPSILLVPIVHSGTAEQFLD